MERFSMDAHSGASTEVPSKCSGCIKCSKQVASFLLSHIGLLSLVVGYCIMGAFIFEELEKHNEIETKRSMRLSRLQMSDKIWDITKDMEVLHQENWTRQVTESLRKFEKSLIIALKENGWDGKEDEETVTWSFAGALFYSITVITTIGYGHIAPKTPAGKVVTIFYAILGIPITVICWSNIGDAMAKAFRFCYWKICCYVYTKKTKKRRRRMLSRHRALSMRHPAGVVRRRSVRSARNQRPSQRSADSKVTTLTGDSKLTVQTIDSRTTAQSTESKTASLSILDGQSSPVSETQQGSPPIQLQLQVSESQIAQSNTASESQPDAIIRVPDTPISAEPKPEEEKPVSKMSEKSGERIREVSEKVLSKIRSAKKSANLALEFDSRSLHSKASPESEAPPGVITEDMKGLSARARAILRAEKDSQKSQHSASGGSNGSHGQALPTPSISRGQRVARLPDEYDDQSYYEEFYYADSEDDLDEFSKRPVPILLSVLLVVAYIIGGAFLFQMWEGWSFLDSSYFCFITLTTIGFGDFTPDQKNVDGEQRIALCSIYLLFGIAMIAMSFNLVQEEVINSVKSVGKMIGIVKDTDDEEDY